MQSPPIPPSEARRLEILAKYAILDTPPEAAFDDLTALAAHICRAPIALITLVDEDRQWLKSRFGWDVKETPRAISFCAHAILQPETFIIPDATRDPRFADNPFVAGEPHIRFYAGCPLITEDGETLGTLCVLDHKRRELHPDHEHALRILSHHVMTLLELRRARRELAEVRGMVTAEAALRESHEQLSQLTEHINQVFWITNPSKNRMLYVSPAYERIWGRSREDLYADPVEWLNAVHPGDRERVRAAMPKQLDGSYREEYRVVCPDGTVRWIRDRAFPVSNESGEVYRIVGVADDVTDSKRAHEALVKERQLSDETINSLPGVFYVFDDEGRYLRWNDNFETVSGYSADEIATLHPLDFFRGGDRELIQQRIGDVFATGQGDAEAHLVSKDGRATPYYFTGRRIELDGRPYIIGMGMDISELRRAEAERDRLFNLSPDLFAIAGFDGYLKQLNPAWEQTLGFSRAELMARPFVDVLVHPEDRERTAAALGGSQGNEPEEAFENRYLCRDGSYRWLSWRSAIVPEEGLVYGVARDVTAQKEISTALQESEQRYRGLVEGAQDGIFTLAADGTITSANHAFEVITGWSRDEWVGKSFQGIIHPEDLPRAIQLFEALMGGEPAKFQAIELRFATKDGDYVPMELTATPKRRGDEIVGLLGIARDVRERHRMEEELRQIQKLDSIGRLTAGIAHDFNNLLTVQQANLSLLLMEPGLSEPVVDHIQDVATAADRAAALTRQLLLFSRKRTMQRRQFELNDVVATLAKMLERVVGENIDLHVECDDNLPAVRGDPGLMEQVVMNLVVNARDAMPDGGPIHIATHAVTFDSSVANAQPGRTRPGRLVCLTVVDTGHGISPELKDKIFEPFFTTKDVAEGTGLGLSTVYGIVQQHEGWIEVESEPDRGATFRIYIPAVEPTDEAEDESDAITELRGGAETILAVEDEAALRRIVKTVLERYGYRVLMAGNGAEALELWREHGADVDLLLTDLIMPHGISGWDLAKRLRAERPDLKVLVMSGYDPKERAIDVGETGVDQRVAFLQKPYNLSELVRLTRACLDEVSPSPD